MCIMCTGKIFFNKHDQISTNIQFDLWNGLSAIVLLMCVWWMRYVREYRAGVCVVALVVI